MADENALLSDVEMAEELAERYPDTEIRLFSVSADQTFVQEEVVMALAKAVVPRAMRYSTVQMTPAAVKFLVEYGISAKYLSSLLDKGEEHALKVLSAELSELFKLLSFNGLLTTAILERVSKRNRCPRPYTGLC